MDTSFGKLRHPTEFPLWKNGMHCLGERLIVNLLGMAQNFRFNVIVGLITGIKLPCFLYVSGWNIFFTYFDRRPCF